VQQQMDNCKRLGQRSEVMALILLRWLGRPGVGFQSFDDPLRQKLWSVVEHICHTLEQHYVSLLDGRHMRQTEAKYAGAGFPGCVGCVDVLHVPWPGSPAAQHGSFSGKDGTPTIAVEAVCDRLLRGYHVFAERAGANNDLSVLARSSIWNKRSAKQGSSLQHRWAGLFAAVSTCRRHLSKTAVLRTPYAPGT